MSKPKKVRSKSSQNQASQSKGFDKKIIKTRPSLKKHKQVDLQAGIAFFQSGSYEKAYVFFREAVEKFPHNSEALYLLAIACNQRKEYDLAEKHIRRAIAIVPAEAKYHCQLGNTLQDQGKFDKAIESFEAVVKTKPNFTDIYYNLGNAHLLNNNFDKAIAAYRKNLKIDPKHYDSFNNLGHAFLAIEAYQDAFDAFEKTIELRPQDYSGYNHLGTVFQQQEKYEEALQYFQKAINIDPTNPNIKYNLGNALQEQGNISNAINIYQEVLEQQPDNIQAKFNLGWSLLLAGKLPQGWAGYESRFKASDSLPPLIDSPLYSGSLEKDKALFVWSEQGLGDSLQFIRYAVFLQQQGMDITISVNPLLIKLFENCLELSLKIVDQNQIQLSEYKDHIPLLSLPHLLQTNENTIPLDIPYIHSPSRISNKNNLSEKLKEFNIGIVWGSSLTNPKMYRSKSITLSSFLDSQAYLQNSKKIAIFSLQVGEDTSQIQPFLNEWNNLHDLSLILNDFYDTASIIKQLDLVITVDTAVAHLAGAMGKSVWVMLPFVPDWRWQLKRKDTPWYPTMTLFRQHQCGDWGSVFGEIEQALVSWLNRDIENSFLFSQHNQLNFAEDNLLKDLCTKGEDLLTQGQLDQAIAAYEKAIELQPENVEILNALGNLYQKIENWDKATECFHQAILVSPNNAGLYFNLGNTFLFQKNYAEAEVAYREAIALQPKDAGFLNNLGYSLQQQSKYDEALQIFQHLLSFAPNDVNAHNHLGNIYQEQEEYSQAIQSFQKSLSLDPNNADIQYNLGNVLQLSRDLPAAIEAYKDAIKLDPQNAV
ncbi:MAG: tetratricopeptide repeat protein, partial [Limnothrix sp.]